MNAQELKELQELQKAYLSVYEAKKVDQDEDGDNDFADVRIARMIASGVSKEEAIRRVRDKEYNEAYVPWDFGPRDKAKAKHAELAQRKAAGGSAPGTATRANRIASVGREMRTTLDKDSAVTMTNPKKQGLQPSTPRHTAAALRGAGGGGTARTQFDVKPLKPTRSSRGGGSSAQNLGSSSGTRGYQVGGSQGHGISGIKLADEFELWVNDLLDEGYDLSDYTWDEMYESYLNEATRMRKELGKEGEIATRKELARHSNEYQRSGSVDKTIAAAERGAKNPYIKHIRGESDVDRNTRRRVQSDTLTKLAANRRKSVRSGEGLRGYAADVSGDDKDLQSARGSARSAGTLTPKEKKKLGEQYNLVLSYLLDEGYANTEESALVIMANMSEEWREDIVEDFINEKVKYSDNDYRGGGGDEKRRQTGMSSREVAKLGRQNINRAIEKEPLGTQIKQKAFGREVPVPPNAGFKPGGLRMLPATAPGSIFSSPSTWRSKSGNINNGYVPVEDNIIEGPDYNRNTNFSDNDYRGGGGDEKRLRTGMSTREVSQLGRQNINRAIEKEPIGTQIKQKLFGREVPVPPNAGFKPGGLRMLPDKKSSGRPTLKGDPLPGPRAKYHGPAR